MRCVRSIDRSPYERDVLFGVLQCVCATRVCVCIGVRVSAVFQLIGESLRAHKPFQGSNTFARHTADDNDDRSRRVDRQAPHSSVCVSVCLRTNICILTF